MAGTVLVVDDEELFRLCMCAHLERAGYRTIAAETGVKAVELVESRRPDIVLMDVEMPEMDGLTAFRLIRQSRPDLPVVLISAHSSVESAVKTVRAGARAFLVKPFELRDATQTLERILSEDRSRRVAASLRTEPDAFDGIVGTSFVIQNARALLSRATTADTPTLLIEGPAGVGKSLSAELFHSAGPRRDGPYVKLDCGAIPEDGLEAALFGRWPTENGKRGALEAAEGGTLVLDHVAALSHRGQGLLLNALERRTFRRVGGIVDIPIGCTVVATSRRALRSEVRAERFREGLYYRLALVTVPLPALSTRPEDLDALVPHFVDRAAREFGRSANGVSPAALALLTEHGWPGNVQELRSAIDRAVLMSAGAMIEPADLPAEVRGAPPELEEDCPFDLPAGGVTLGAVERGLLIQALGRTRGDERAAASLLGLSLVALRERMLQVGVRPNDMAARAGRGSGNVIEREFGRAGSESGAFLPFRERVG